MTYNPNDPRSTLNAFRVSPAEEAMIEDLCQAESLNRSELFRQLIRQAHRKLSHPRQLKHRPPEYKAR